MEVELRSALEGQNRAQADASETSLAQDDVVSQARIDRDTAIQRRTKAEIELAKTRVELMQANSELLEAINQKVELSQQLEQWQVRCSGSCRANSEQNCQIAEQNRLHRTRHTHPYAGIFFFSKPARSTCTSCSKNK